MAQASASYWIAMQDSQGNVSQWMWNCENCPAVGLATSEKQVVRDMNAHVKADHPKHDYSSVPVPE